MKTLVLILFIFSLNNLFSQTNTRSGPREYNVFLLPQGFGNPLLNSEGVSAIDNNVSNISFINPASIGEFPNYNFALSYQFQTSITEAYILDIGVSRVYNYFPQSVGGVFHYNNFSFGIGFGQKYNASIDFGKIPVTTIQNPDGTGKYFTPEIERILYNCSLIVSHSFKKIFSNNSDLSLGVKYNLNILNDFERIAFISSEASLIGSNFEFGAAYNIKYDEDKNIYIGISYSIISNVEGKFNYQSDNRTAIPGSTPGIYEIESPFIVRVKIPDELRFDVKVKPISNLKLFGSIRGIFWNNVSENLKNQIEFSSSAVYSFNNSLTVSAGFYSTGRNYKEDYFDKNRKMYALYITAGLGIEIDKFNIDIAIADSHLFSGTYWKQTIGKITFGIQL